MRSFIVLAALIVAGCASFRAADVNRAKTELVGLTRAELFGCAGVPTRSAIEGSLECLVYNSAGSSSVTGVGQATGGTAFFGGTSRSRYAERGN